jgi:hypothetical protein
MGFPESHGLTDLHSFLLLLALGSKIGGSATTQWT